VREIRGAIINPKSSFKN